MSTSTSYTTAETDLTELVVVRAWPLLDWGAWSIVAVGVLVVFATAIGLATQSIVSALAAVGVVLLAGWRLLVPIHYELGPDGITQSVLRFKRHLRWRSIGCFRIGRQGVLLLHAHQPIRFDTARGLYIPWHDHRNAMLEILRQHLDEAQVATRGK